MASNYERICDENRERYGTIGAQKSGRLAAGLYDDRAHFIFELLQNAEDALGKRFDWNGPRKVVFDLTSTRLTVSHFGKPFDEADVRSVCDIDASTKNENSIGRFGLGFKSVYAVTNLPEIHSGDEDFAIEEYVFPKRLDPGVREEHETRIVLPLKPDDEKLQPAIVAGFRNLGPESLLFLRHTDEIGWSVENGASGFYLRAPPEILGKNVQRVKVIGVESGQSEVDQHWLVFHRDVFSTNKQKVGRVEIAFSLAAANGPQGDWAVQPLAKSPLVVFFPTVVESHLGFLVQGPYRTTPSRDNIPSGEPWNQHLVSETAKLLVESLCWMRDESILNVASLRCLPLAKEKFPSGSRFAPLFDAVRSAFRDEALLPTFDNKFITVAQARLARTQELRELLSSEQLAGLFKVEAAIWLSGEITQDKTPDFRSYLIDELGLEEFTPAKLIPLLTNSFLELQTDDWVLRLYEFLSGQEAALRRHLDRVPLVRLEDGSHVVAREKGQPNAFLPTIVVTGFPTVRRGVCSTSIARAFLSSLQITEPDPVDDVIRNILPKYKIKKVDFSEHEYAVDIERIIAAFNTDSAALKEKLRTALRDTSFVMAVETGGNESFVAKPVQVYIASDRLRQLFSEVEGVLIVDNDYECLRGEGIRDLLVACGASRYLNPEPIPCTLSDAERMQIRKESGLERATLESQPEDFTLRGLNQLLELLPKLPPDEARIRAEVLWEAMIDLEGRGSSAFYGSFKWSYFHESKAARFDAAFVRLLNQIAWIPGGHGELLPPRLVVFSTLGWRPNQFLLTKIAFKPPILDQLAKEAGIDPAALDLLRKYGITSVDELASRLGISGASANIDPSSDVVPNTDEKSDGRDVYGEAKELYGDDMPEIPSGSHDPDGGDIAGGGGAAVEGRGGSGTEKPHDGARTQSNRGTNGDSGGQGIPGGKGGNGGGHGKRSPGHNGGRPFISYVATHVDDHEPDSEGLDQATRMRIEEMAIALIIKFEPTLRRTKDGNPGFDLYDVDERESPIRWIEVKSMSGDLEDRPVGLSRAQFECARVHGDAYWLYVVEHADDPVRARVLRIQDPFGHARTFTFDRGWIHVAQIESSLPSAIDREGH